MRAFGTFLGVLVIAICGVVLLVSGFCGILLLQHGELSVPLLLTAAVCAAIIFGVVKALRNGPR